MTKRSIGPRTLLYPHPDLIIGTYGPGGRPDAMAAAWGGICSSRPPAVAVSVQKTRQTYENLLKRREFTSLGKEAPCASGGGIAHPQCFCVLESILRVLAH